jgi:hypothetical protein
VLLLILGGLAVVRSRMGRAQSGPTVRQLV